MSAGLGERVTGGAGESVPRVDGVPKVSGASVELRLTNAPRTGSVLPTGQVLAGAAPVREIIEACRDLPPPRPEPAWGRDSPRYPGGTGKVTRGEGLKRGVGFAVGYKNVAFSEGFDDSAAARTTLSHGPARTTLSHGPDGPVAEIYTAAVEMGQVLYTLLTQIVRTELGQRPVPYHHDMVSGQQRLM